MATKNATFNFPLSNKLSTVLESSNTDEHYFFSKDAFYYKDKVKKDFKKYFCIHIDKEDEVISMLMENHNVYELIPADCYVKPYFDLEMENVTPDRWFPLLDLFKSILALFFEQEFSITLQHDNFIVLNSCRENKLSFHLIIDGFYYDNNTVQKRVVELLKDRFHLFQGNEMLRWIHSNGERRLIFDIIPYGRNQNFRCINQSKIGKQHVLFSSAEIKKCFVRVFKHKLDGLICINIENETETDNEGSIDIEHNIDGCINVTNNTFVSWLEAGIQFRLFEKLSSYSEWIKIGMLIKQVLGDNGFIFFNEISKQHPDYDVMVVEEKWKSFSYSGNLSIGSLKHFYKMSNPQKYVELCNTLGSLDETELIRASLVEGSDFDIAVAFEEFVRNKFIYCNKKWIGYDEEQCIWSNEFGEQIRVIMSTEFFEIYNRLKHVKQKEETDKKKALAQSQLTWKADINNSGLESKVANLKNDHDKCKYEYEMLSKVCSKLKTTSNKSNILTELVPIISNSVFLDDANKLLYHIALRDGTVMDIRNCSIRQRTPEDKFTAYSDVVFKSLTEAEFLFADTYFNQVFCNNQQTKQCFLDIIKTCLCGLPLRYFYFCIGNGSNGKSALFKIISDIFGKKVVDTISKKIVVGGTIGSGNLSTEFACLDKCRIGIVSELSSTDKVNIENLKTISGGDEIVVRELYREERTITPTTNCFTLLNPENIPNIEMSNSVRKRIVIIPFNAVFEADPDFTTRMFDRRDDIFSYIMQQGKLVMKGEFDLSDEMKFSKEEFEEYETTDYLKQFIEQHYEITEDTTDRVKRDEVRMHYVNWLSTNKLIDNNAGLGKFVRRIKATFQIENKKSNNINWLHSLKKRPQNEFEETD